MNGVLCTVVQTGEVSAAMQESLGVQELLLLVPEVTEKEEAKKMH